MPAGPIVELQGSQVRGRRTARYVLATRDVDPYALVEDAFVDLQVATGAGLGELADEYQALDISGMPVSSVRRRHGRLEVRAFNPRREDAVLAIAGRTGRVVDLRGTELAPFSGSVTVRPYGIVTVRLDEAV
jgi:hypothetical protein